MIIKLSNGEILALIRYHADVICHSTEDGINGGEIPALIQTTKRMKDLAVKFQIGIRKEIIK